MSASPSSNSPPPGLTLEIPPAATPAPAPNNKNNNEASAPAAAADDADSAPASPDLPLTMEASLLLSALPQDATAALSEAHAHIETKLTPAKIVVRFKAVGSAPPLPAKRELSRVSASSRFEAVVSYLRRVLKVGEGEGVCLYVNNCFAPALDEVVGNLWRVSTLFFFNLICLHFGRFSFVLILSLLKKGVVEVVDMVVQVLTKSYCGISVSRIQTINSTWAIL